MVLTELLSANHGHALKDAQTSVPPAGPLVSRHCCLPPKEEKKFTPLKKWTSWDVESFSSKQPPDERRAEAPRSEIGS